MFPSAVVGLTMSCIFLLKLELLVQKLRLSPVYVMFPIKQCEDGLGQTNLHTSRIAPNQTPYRLMLIDAYNPLL